MTKRRLKGFSKGWYDRWKTNTWTLDSLTPRTLFSNWLGEEPIFKTSSSHHPCWMQWEEMNQTLRFQILL